MKPSIPIVLFVLTVLLINGVRATETYRINDAEVESLFSQSEDVTHSLTLVPLNMLIGHSGIHTTENKEMIAGIIALASVALGVGILVPFHRFYLGTGGKGATIFVLYFCTLSCFSLLTVADGIFLLIDSGESGRKYIGNSHWIMWQNDVKNVK